MVVRFEFMDAPRAVQNLGHVDISPDEIFGLMTCFQPVGFWRSDLASGHAYWSADIFEIFGMDCKPGPVNVAEAYSRAHPDDVGYMLEAFERASRQKMSFHLVMRIRAEPGGWKYIRCVGRFRVTTDGREELYGMIEQFLDQVPTIGVHDVAV